MGDLSKLKVAVGQPEYFEGRPGRNAEVQAKMFTRAVEAGADLLVMPGSLFDATNLHLIAINDSRIDVAGNSVMLEACGESYKIGLGGETRGCDFAVCSDTTPWSASAGRRLERPGIVLRPVGMSNVGKKVLVHDGGSAVYNRSGRQLARLRDDFEEDFAIMSLSEEGERFEMSEDKLLTSLVKAIRRFDDQVLGGSSKWVIGLSGGLDSSVVAALLTLALGPERVSGFNLSTRFNSDETKSNATAVADALGIKLADGSIEPVVQAMADSVCGYGYTEESLEGVPFENVQARVRGNLLSTFAALEQGVVVNCGNKVEAALGYATLYGDAIGALAPIGDLTKVRLFDLARAINGQPSSGVIPENLLPAETEDGLEWQTMPSAELSDGQRDPMKWFYHDWLIEQLVDAPDIDAAACTVMERYLEDRLESTPAGKWVRFYGLDDSSDFIEDFDWVVRQVRRSAFKRIQAPPAITVASQFSVDAAPESQGVFEPSQAYTRLRERFA